MPDKINKAIDIITEARKTNVEWLAFINGNDDWKAHVSVDILDNERHYQEWIENYDFVLAVLGELNDAS